MLVPGIFGDVVDDFFDDDWARPVRDFVGFSTPNTTIMKTDVKELNDAYELDVELPGYTKDEVKVELKDGVLTVSASKAENKDDKDKDGKYVRRERFQGSCQRNFNVGDTVKQDDISAKFENGVLKLKIAKQQPEPEVEENHFIRID